MISSVAFVTALAGMLGNTITSTEALSVLTPVVAESVASGRPYLVSWQGAQADDRFEVDLHYCGSYSFCFGEAEDCGFWIANVCTEADDACMNQDDQSSQVTFPEPVAGHSNNGYRVRISEVGTDNFRCSEDFYLVASTDVLEFGEPGGPTMEVVAPEANALAVAGETYTVEFDYDNGFGEQLGRFKIDLYKAEGNGDCGSWVTSVCDKPDMGCRDSGEFYSSFRVERNSPDQCAVLRHNHPLFTSADGAKHRIIRRSRWTEFPTRQQYLCIKHSQRFDYATTPIHLRLTLPPPILPLASAANNRGRLRRGYPSRLGGRNVQDPRRSVRR
ncbi:unnamed protein product [Ectocarpus sp. 6 AP-2014]